MRVAKRCMQYLPAVGIASNVVCNLKIELKLEYGIFKKTIWQKRNAN